MTRPRLSSRFLACAALAAGAQLISASAAAHIELLSPLNRYSDIRVGDNKACPCGSGTTNRSCRKPEEWSDPDRSTDRATTFAPGDTITVQFDEYVGHGGRYRIAFDPDGADLDDFNANILLDEPDPSGSVGNMGQGSMWEFDITLPEMTCDHCTLQLIQVMDGNTTDKVLNPVDRGGTYFQCADIVLADGAPPGGLEPVAPTDHPGARGRPNPIPAALPASDAMSSGSTATGSGTTMGSGTNVVAPASGGTQTSSGDTAAMPMMGAAGDGGGCSLTTGVRPGNGGGAALGGLAALLLGGALRSRRRRPSA